jgi:preprotein translocase subunit YajC
MGDWFIYVVLAGMIGLMFFNSRKRKKQLAELRESIKVGASVVLHSGITGRIVSMEGDRLVLESTPGTNLSVLQGAVRGIDSWSGAKPAASVAFKPAAKKTTAAAPKTVAKKAPAKPTTK